MMMCRTDKMLREESHAVEKAKLLGLEAEVLSPSDVRRLNPGLDVDISGAAYYPQDCHLDPQKFMTSLTQLVRSMDATFLWETEVVGWRTQNRRIEAMQTRQGEISADEFVLAAGSWSPTLTKGLQVRLPMQAGKGYAVTLPEPRQLPSMGCLLMEARIAVTPMGRTLRVGGTMEIVGLDESINQRRVNGIIKSFPQYFPAFRTEDFQNLPVWCGLRPCSPDGLPYIGRFSRYDNLSAATGHAMMGLSLAPITGKLMARILSGATPEIPLELVRPDRF
jgi:D-amino-acid dehydrogenase